jgi:hypothetical protein
MKQAYYFQHDNNSYTDEKIIDLRMKHGLIGYATYWVILEQLHQNQGKMKIDSKRIAFGLQLDATIVESIIKDFDLFEIDGEYFYSKRMIEHFNKRQENIEKRSIAGKKGAEARWNKTSSKNGKRIANVCDSHSKKMANDGKGKERKGKESKGNNINNNTNVFLETFNKSFESNYRPTNSRTKKLTERLKAFSLQEILQAVENMSQSPFHRGVNDRGWKADPDFILRNDEQIDKFINYQPEQAKELARKVSSANRQNRFGKPTGVLNVDEELIKRRNLEKLQGNGRR